MLSWFIPIGLSGKLWSTLALWGAAIMALALPGLVKVETYLTLYENEQWQARKVLEISGEVWALVEQKDPSVAAITQQVEALKQENAANPQFSYQQQPRSNGGVIITAGGNGQGFTKLNQLFFGGQAQISAQGAAITLVASNLEPNSYTEGGGSYTIRIDGAEITASNATQPLLVNNTTAIWENSPDLNLTATPLSGSPGSMAIGTTAALSEMAVISGAAVITPSAVITPPPPPVPVQANIIRNGDFELPFPKDGVAPEWTAFDNGRAHFGWYEELWPEAVHRGRRAQLMEIFEMEANVLERVMAIQQTVTVLPNSTYSLTMYTIMRSSADAYVRDRFEVEMHWGVDPLGEGNYENVTEWVPMYLDEQVRLGSTAPYPDDIPLVYERITGTIRSGADTRAITLFIRGMKKFSNNCGSQF